MRGEYSAESSFSHGKPATTAISLRGPAATAATVRGVVQKSKRVKLRARELARLQCHNLELDIMNLKQEIATLKTTRSLLYARTLNRADAPALGSFEKIIREFYLLSHAGFFKVVWRKDAQSEPVDMVRFMRTCFDESLAVGVHSPPTPGGLDSFLAMMDQMVVVLDSPKVSVLSARVRANEADSTATVTVTTRCASYLTATLLDALFPHLSEWFPQLRAKLLGREMVTIGEGDFTFSARHGRVVRVDLRLDQTASILKLAESMEELHILEGKWTPRPVEVGIVEDNYAGSAYQDCVEQEYDVSETESKPPSECARSPMSLQHLLSPEHEDDNQSESEEQTLEEPSPRRRYEWRV